MSDQRHGFRPSDEQAILTCNRIKIAPYFQGQSTRWRQRAPAEALAQPAEIARRGDHPLRGGQKGGSLHSVLRKVATRRGGQVAGRFITRVQFLQASSRVF